MKFLDLFAGIGGFRMGMERAGHHCVGYVEIDKFARQSYEAIYDTTGEWTAHDITQVTDEEWRQFKGKADVICGGFPCQSFSIAGKRKGFADETRGTLFFEIARAAKQIKPSYLFLENVKGLLNHDKGRTFRTVLSTLDEFGYDVEWQLCNSKNFGVPQNRERIIIIGHLRGASTREVFFDAGQDGQATSSNEINDLLPVSSPRHGRRGTVLGTDGISSALAATDYKLPKQIAVHQVGNISDSSSFGGNPQVGCIYATDGISPTLNTMQGGGREPKIIDDQGRRNKRIIPTDISPTLRAQSHGNEPKVAIPVITPDRINKRQNGRRFKENGDPMFTINTVDRHGVLINMNEPKIAVREATKKGYDVAKLRDSINFSQPNSKTRRGRVGHGVANTLTTIMEQDALIQVASSVKKYANIVRPNAKPIVRITSKKDIRGSRQDSRKSGLSELQFTNPNNKSSTVTASHAPKTWDKELRIRKLTPRECWRLQGFPDWAFDKAQEVNSNSQLYKQAGNSVTVPVIYEIAKRLVIESGD